MKKLLLLVIAFTLGIFTVNAQKRLESITCTNTGDNRTYVYEEGTNKVVTVKEGVYNEQYGSQDVTFVTYENDLLTKTERVSLWNNEPDYSYEWTINKYNYENGVLTSYTEEVWKHWYSDDEPYDVTEYTLVYDGDKVTSITFGNSKIAYTYENGRLVQEEKSYYDQGLPGDVVEYSIEYAYDEAGNCISATKAQYGNETVTSYIYAETLAADVYCFAFPHEIKPVNKNIIKTAQTGENIATYNYNFSTVAKPIAPAGLTAEVLSDTEVALTWEAREDATSYNVYNGAEKVAENVKETTYTVTGLTPETEYTFTVTAVNEGGESDPSNADTVTTLKAVEFTPEAVAFGEVTLGANYWSKAGATREVSFVTFGKEVKSVTVDNAFFTLPETIDYTAETITFAVGYDINGAEGAQEGVITVTLANDATYTIPVTATAYTPVTPDVFELAQEITFTDGVYTDTPAFATLHDNYLGAPDAVYAFTLEDNQAVEVKVTGTNGKYAIYSETLGFENSVEREDKVLSTAFSYDFNDGSLEDFIVEDYDKYKDFTWEVDEDGYLYSYSFLGVLEDNNWVVYVDTADERIITKAAYELTEHSVLTMDINVDGWISEEIIVEVTTDGESFTELAKVCDDELTYSKEWMSKRVNIGAKLAEAGLEFGEYQISLRHNIAGSGRFAVDNLSLTERGLVYPAGKYYLVAAAEEEFTVEVISVDYTGDEEITLVPNAPVLSYVATATTDTTVTLTWEAVAGAASYNVYNGTELVENVAETTYTVTGLTAETEYSFTVTAVNNAGESDASNVVKVTTLAAEGEEPEQPVDPEQPGEGEEPEEPADTVVLVAPVVAVVDSLTTDTTVTLVWNVVEGALSYNVYMDTVLVENVADTTYTVTGLTAETTYSFTVTAVADTLESVASEVVTVTTLAAEEGEEPGTGIVENAAVFSIYPNPAVDRLVIETESTIESVSIYTLTGVMIYSEVDFNNNTINVSDFASGVYFIKVRTDNGEAVQRFIKK